MNSRSRTMNINWYRRVLFALAIISLAAGISSCYAPPAPGSRSSFGAELWFPNDPKAQALAIAAERGDAAEIQRLMKAEGVNPDRIFSKESLPLLVWPIYTKNPAGLKAMLENGANPNARFPVPEIEIFKDGSYSVSFKNNAMVWAAKNSNPIYLRLLLDHGGAPNTRNSNSETLLFQAFIYGKQWENIKLLVERNADINARSKGTTILEDFAGGGGFMQAFWLLEHGADPKLNYIRDPAASPDQSHIIDAIFWHPGNPKDSTWQRKCQQWLLQHGYKRPPLSKQYRDMRQRLGFPYEEEQIPLL